MSVQTRSTPADISPLRGETPRVLQTLNHYVVAPTTDAGGSLRFGVFKAGPVSCIMWPL